MKLFNVAISVEITCVGELQEAAKSEETFSEMIDGENPGSDPIKTQAKLLDKLYGKFAPTPAVAFPGRAEGVTMNQTVKIAAGSFEELQKVLQKFHALAESLQVPA